MTAFSSKLLARIARPLAIATALFVLPSSTPAAEYIWSGGGGATWDTSNTNWTAAPANTWDVTNGPTNIARFNIDGDVANISGTVYTSSIRFSGDDAVVNGTGDIRFGTSAATITLRADAGKTGTINANFGTLASAPVSNDGNKLAKTFAGKVIYTGQAFLYGDANQQNTTAGISVEGGGELEITGFVKARSSMESNRNNNFTNTVGQTSANNILTLSGSGAAYVETNGAQTRRLLIGTLSVGGATFGGNAVVVSSPGSLAAPTMRMYGNGTQLNMGVSSSANSFTISNGGYVRQSLGGGTNTWTFGTNNGADNNFFLVTGTNSTVDRSGAAGSSINVGAGGSGNYLKLAAGGQALPGRLGIGTNGGDNNYIQVTGSTSLLNFDNYAGSQPVLLIGVTNGSTGNYLKIDSGGTFLGQALADRQQAVGMVAGADNNYILVTDANSTFTLREGQPLTFGGTAAGGAYTDTLASGNHFDIFNGGKAVQNTVTLLGGTGIVGGSAINLGDGNGLSELQVSFSTASTGAYGAGVRLFNARTRLNMNAGMLTANAQGPTTDFVSGPGQINLIGDGTFKNDLSSSTVRVISSKITGVGNLIKEGVGILRLINDGVSLASNDYSGNTLINNGTLQIGTASFNMIPNGAGKGNVVLNGGASVAGTLDLNNFDETINGLSGTSNVILGQVVNDGSPALRTLTVGDGDATAAFAGLIKNNTSGTGTVGLTKVGSGTQTLSGNNTYTGPTLVSNGTLLINGNQTASIGLVTVSSGATLGGTGTIGGNTDIQGIHSPGNSPGIQTFAGNLTYSGASPSVTWELINNTVINAANPNAIFDTIIVGGNLDFSSATTLNLVFDGGTSAVDWTDSFWSTSHTGTSGWLLYDVAGTANNVGNLSLATINWLDGNGSPFVPTRAGSSFSLFQQGSDIYINYLAAAPPPPVSATPEPATLVLAMLGLAALSVVAKRKRYRHA